MADLDFSGLWSWTLPLWGLFIFVMFLGAVLVEPTILQGVQSGGGRRGGSKQVRWAVGV